MLVKSLDVKEFRGIREFKEPLKFKKFNVLIGKNNCGKSSIIEALAFLPYYSYYFTGSTRFQIISSMRGRTTGEWLNFIYGYSGEAVLKYELTNGLDKLDVLLYINENGASMYYNNSELQSISNLTDIFHMSKGELERFSSIIAPTLSDNIYEFINSRFTDITKKGSHYKIIKDIINPSVDDEFTEIIRDENRLKVRKVVNKDNEDIPLYINIGDLGLGTQKSIISLMYLDYISPKLVLWDDFEANMHPRLLREIIRWLAKRDWQVIIATHSIDLLYYLADLKPKDAQVILMKKKEDVVAPRYINMDELEDMFAISHDPRLVAEEIEI